MRPVGTAELRRQLLGARIDALETAIESAECREPDALPCIERLVASIVTPSFREAYPEVVEQAEKVDASSGDDMVASAKDLVRVLRAAAAGETAPDPVLVAETDSYLSGILRSTIESVGSAVETVTDTAGARTLLRSTDALLLVVSADAPPHDLDAFTAFLHDSPLTTAMPVLIVGAAANDGAWPGLFKNRPVETWTKAADGDAFKTWVEGFVREQENVPTKRRHDELTGLLNQLAFYESFEEAISGQAETGDPLALALMSLDCPRDMRRTQEGGPARQVIRHVAESLKQHVRSTDLLSYWGGSMFAALFPGEDTAGATAAVRKLQNAVKSAPHEHCDEPATCSLSAGIAVAGAGQSVMDAFNVARRMLSEAQGPGASSLAAQRVYNREGSRRVLMILEDAVVARVLQLVFKKEEYATVHMKDATVDVAMDDQKYSLVIVDEKADNGKGLEILSAFRRNARYARVPIIMYLDDASEKAVDHALELGATDCISNPLCPFTFATRMHRLLNGRAKLKPGLSILFVDDDSETLITAATALHQRGGFEVHLGKGIRDGLEQFVRMRPDVLAVSLTMEEGRGIRFLDEIHHSGLADETDIILLTDRGSAQQLMQLVPTEVAGSLSKPLNPLSLGKEIESLLDVVPMSLQGGTGKRHLEKEIQRVLRMP